MMSETNKTLAFVGVAVLALGAAWLGRPKPVGIDLPDLVGEALFPKFTDAYEAKSMKIVEYDEEVGILRNFEVAQQNGLWVIPSKQDYPADAEETLAEAANLLVGLKVINIQSEQKQEHATYGVLRPDANSLKPGDKGVGKLVTFKSESGDRLGELVIGKPVTSNEKLRYVRVADQNPVYIVELDPSKLSTKFEEWIERDILDINSFDVAELTLYDYSANPQLTNRGIALNDQDRLKVQVEWNADDAKWELMNFQEFVGDGMRDSQLLETEELDTEALNTLKRALDDFKIVDVERKPDGLGTEIVEDNFWRNQAGIESLFERGFYAAQDADGNLKLRSSDGEVKVRTNDGIEYHMRFGQVATVDGGTDSQAGEEGEASGLNRFVMISVALDKSAFEKPVLDLPDESSDESAAAGAADGDNAQNDVEGDAETEDQTAQTEDDSDAGEETTEAPESDSASAETDKSEAASEPTDKDEEALDLEREEKIKEYERAMDAYKEEIKKAQEKVDKLNFRFADWYYVVAEDEYRKIRLNRSDIIRGKQSTADEGSDVDAFRQLQETDLESSRPAQ